MKQNRVSIITKQQMRFEGIVYVIDKINRSIFIKDVHCFGTEDRQCGLFIPPNQKISPMIEFRNDQIQEITKIPVKDIDLKVYPGAPIQRDVYRSPQDDSHIITSIRNKTTQEDFKQIPQYQRIQRQIKYLSQSPEKREGQQKSYPLKPNYITNNYLQQKQMQKYKDLLRHK